MSTSSPVPLIVEPHPEDWNGYEFITLIRYNDTNTINIVDNVIGKSLYTYVLDLCAPSGLDESKIIDIATYWNATNREKYPLSIEFSRMGWTSYTNQILRIYPIDFVTRIIGPVMEYPMISDSKVRRRKKRSIER